MPTTQRQRMKHYDPSICTFGGKQQEGNTVRDIIEQRNANAETVL